MLLNDKNLNEDKKENNAPSVGLCTDRILCCYDQGSITCNISFSSFFFFFLFFAYFIYLFICCFFFIDR